MYQEPTARLCFLEVPNYQTLPVSDSRALGSRDAHAIAARPIRSHSIERKFVTVLFIDVKDSMGLSSVIDLEDWWSISAGLFKLTCDGVDEFGGWIGSFTGDGVNAVFGATGRPDHHARRACLAALSLRDGVRTLAGELLGVHGLELSVRIGINSGEVLTGTIRHRSRRVYTANGYAVALAKRMEALAHPHGIYLTEYTATLVTDSFHLHDLGAVAVKGADSPVGVFELIGSACEPEGDDSSPCWRTQAPATSEFQR